MPHSLRIKVYYEDTDASALVYHASYLRFFERGRTDYFTGLGHDPASYHQKGQYFVVTRVDIRYRSPARLGESLDVLTEIETLKRASLVLRQRCLRGGDLMAEAEVTVALIDSDGKPRRLPAELAAALERPEAGG